MRKPEVDRKRGDIPSDVVPQCTQVSESRFVRLVDGKAHVVGRMARAARTARGVKCMVDKVVQMKASKGLRGERGLTRSVSFYT